MSAIAVMFSISLIMALGFLAAFLWAVRSGQFRDSTTPGMRILHDHPSAKAGSKTSTKRGTDT